MFYLILSPRPAYVIGSGVYGENANLMAASWVSPVAEEPPRVAVAIDRETQTWKLIVESGEFTVNVLEEEYLDRLYCVGSVSGRSVDKAKRCQLTLKTGVKVRAPVVEEAVATIECRVYKRFDVGETDLVVGDVVYCDVSEDKFVGRMGWDLRRTRIPLHLRGRAFAFTSRVVVVRRT